MSLVLITGRANAGKTEIVYSMVRAALREGESPYLLVPSQPDVERAADELARSFSLGVRVMTFDGYLAQSWVARGDGRGIVTAGQRKMLLSDIAKHVEGTSRGVVQLADRCAAAITDQVGASWRMAPGIAEGPGAALSALLRDYREVLDRLGLVELAEAAYLMTAGGIPRADPLVAHRFTDLTASQEIFITGAAAAGMRTVVTLTWEQGFAPTEALDALVERLSLQADGHERVAFTEQPGTAPELLHLERELFLPDGEHLEPQGAVRLSYAEGPEAEAVRIAHEVRRLVMEDKVNYSDIAVVFRDCESHSPFIREAFAQAEIPADYDIRVPFGSVPFGRAFLGLFSFALQGDRPGLLSFLRTRFSGVDRDQLSLAEAKWRRGGALSFSGLAAAASALGESPRHKIEAALRCAGRDVEADTVGAWHELADELLSAGYGRGGRPLSGTYESDAWAHAAVTEALSDVVALKNLALAPKDLIDALADRKLAPSELEREGRVQVTAVTRIRARRFRALVLGGLNASEFPARPSEEMLPQGEVAHVLSTFGGQGQQGLGAPYERLLFYQTITRPTDHLVLSACTTDADGEPVPLSPLLEEVLDFYRDGDRVRLEPILRGAVEIPRPGEATTQRDELRALSFQTDKTNPRVRAAVSRASGRVIGLSEESRAALAGREQFSASELELYVSCPYRWFYERALSPQRLDTEFDEAQQGSFAHDVLRGFYEHFLEQTGESRVTVSSLRAGLDILSATFDAAREAVGSAASMSEEMALGDVSRWVRRIVTEDAEMLPGYTPTRFEWDFSENPVDMGGFQLRGRVDRIDEDDGGAIVTDYKRSKAFTAAEMLRCGKVQLPLYLRAVQVRLGLEPVGGLYRALRKHNNRGLLRSDAVSGPMLASNDLVTSVEFEERIEGAVELARGAADGIRQARIPREPRVAKACENCPASRVCAGRA